MPAQIEVAPVSTTVRVVVSRTTEIDLGIGRPIEGVRGHGGQHVDAFGEPYCGGEEPAVDRMPFISLDRRLDPEVV